MRVLLGCHLGLLFRRSNTEHRKEDAAFIGVGRISGDNAACLTRGAVSKWFDIAKFGGIRFGRHHSTLGDARMKRRRLA